MRSEFGGEQRSTHNWTNIISSPLCELLAGQIESGDKCRLEESTPNALFTPRTVSC